MGLTTDRNDPGIKTILPNGQQEKYLVLSEEERAKGFVRPVRRSYKHVGIAGPRYALRDLTDEEKGLWQDDPNPFVKFEIYPETEPGMGRYWTQKQLDSVGKGCQTVTTMGQVIAETYARNPGYYGGTFCCHCGCHLPVGRDGEFIWLDDGSRVGT